MSRVLFLGEGSSDEGIAGHIERIAYECGVEIAITVPKMELIPSDDKSVKSRLDAIRRLGGEYDLAIIHRDGDRDGREARLDEIRRAVESVMLESAFAAVIPIRMTEAWLVLDEMALRTVAGNPNSKVPLPIPGAAEAERIADPKALLRDILVAAAELTGRKRRIFQTHFPNHRRLLLQRLSADGPVRKLRSWKDFDRDVREAFVRMRQD